MTALERLRREKGWTGFKLAIMIQVHPSGLSQVERGHRKSWPAFRERVSAVFGVPVETLFHEDGSPR